MITHSPTSNTEVKEILELYPYTPLYIHGELYGELYFMLQILTTKNGCI